MSQSQRSLVNHIFHGCASKGEVIAICAKKVIRKNNIWKNTLWVTPSNLLPSRSLCQQWQDLSHNPRIDLSLRNDYEEEIADNNCPLLDISNSESDTSHIDKLNFPSALKAYIHLLNRCQKHSCDSKRYYEVMNSNVFFV